MEGVSVLVQFYFIIGTIHKTGQGFVRIEILACGNMAIVFCTNKITFPANWHYQQLRATETQF